MTLPRAQLARVPTHRLLLGWLGARLRPPGFVHARDGVSGGGRWTITGALAACMALALFAALESGAMRAADFALTLGWTIFAAFGVTLLFWPFLASYLMWLGLRYAPPLRGMLSSRTGAAVYGATWHGLAHTLVVGHFAGHVLAPALLVPLIVGGLWGSWLPATIDD